MAICISCLLFPAGTGPFGVAATIQTWSLIPTTEWTAQDSTSRSLVPAGIRSFGVVTTTRVWSLIPITQQQTNTEPVSQLKTPDQKNDRSHQCGESIFNPPVLPTYGCAQYVPVLPPLLIFPGDLSAVSIVYDLETFVSCFITLFGFSAILSGYKLDILRVFFII